MSDYTIHKALSPRVAVLSSLDVDRLVQLNGLPHLAALLRPFESSVERLSVRTSQLETRLCQRFPLRFDPYSTFDVPTNPTDAARVSEELLDRVTAHISSNAKSWDASVQAESGSAESPASQRSLSIEKQTPWFADFCDAVLQQRFISRHETFGHPVAVLLAVSSASPDPMNDFAQLYETVSSSSAFEAHPYLDPNILRYYLLLHDVRTSGPDLGPSLDLLNNVKKTYGLHCCLLPINSAEEGSHVSEELQHLWDEPWMQNKAAAADGFAPPTTIGRHLDGEDVKRLKGFIRELTAQSIVPFMERCVQQWNEQLANSRKGLTNRLFGASRKFFGAAKANAPSSANPGYNTQHDFYPFASVEAQTRRLADFAFTIRDYKLAAAMYDLGRKDFSSDRAWRHSAGATEMFGLSHLMLMYTSRTPPIDVDSYLSQACHEYSLKPGAENSPLRATLLYYEAYRALDYYRPAPAALRRMANTSEEVFGALLLEQAAMADLRRKPEPALRKCALYLVMAGHRYHACGQKPLSLRCYAQAAALYRGKSWTLIENHLERELGMQAYNGGDANGAVDHLSTLLRPGPCSAEEHEQWLKDLLTAYKYAGAEGSPKPVVQLQQPTFDPKSATIRIDDASTSQSGSLVAPAVWSNLETVFLEIGFPQQAGSGSKAGGRKRPSTLLSSRSNRIAVGATFWLDLVVENPLNVSIDLTAIRPRVRPEPRAAKMGGDDADGAQVEPETSIEADDIGTLTLGPREARRLSIPIRVGEVGTFRVTHVSFILADELPFDQALEKRGKRLTATKEQRLQPTYALDESLRLTVHEPEPAVSAHLVSPPTTLLLGEECRVELRVGNAGLTDVQDVRILCNQPDSAAALLGAAEAVGAETADSLTLANDLKPSAIQILVERGERLSAGEERSVTMLLRGTRPGIVELAWLLVFADKEGNFYTSRLSHRFEVEPSLEVTLHSRPSQGLGCSYDLVMDVTNASLGETLTVTGVSFVGPNWRISKEQNPPFEPASLEPWQASRLHAVVERQQADSDHVSSMAFTVDRLKTMLQNREVPSRQGPPPTKLRISGSGEETGLVGDGSPFCLREARLRWRRATLASQFGALSEVDRSNAFLLYEPNDVDAIVHWKSAGAGQSMRRGHLCIFGLGLGPLKNELRALGDSEAGGGSAIRSMYAQTVKERAFILQNVLSSRLAKDEAPVVVDMRFAESTSSPSVARLRLPARLEVKIQLRNMSDSLVVGYELQLDRRSSTRPASDVGAPTGTSDEVEARARWIGRQTLRGQLAPGSGVELRAHVRVECAGVARLGEYTLCTTCFEADAMGDGGALPDAEAACSRFTQHLDAGSSLLLVEEEEG
ncbi:hypothetical protein ACQY0O_001018 [Thecaphora frezii]